MLAVNVPAELKVVRQHEIAEATEITHYLLFLLFAVEGRADIFRLDVAERRLAPHDGKVRSAILLTLRLVRCNDSAPERFDKGFKRRAVRVLCRVTGGERLFDLFKVLRRERHRVS